MERLPIISHNTFKAIGFDKSRSPSSPYVSKQLQTALKRCELLQMDLNGSKCLQMAQNGSKLLVMAPNGPKWLQMSPNGSK